MRVKNKICSYIGFKKAAIEILPADTEGSLGTPWTEPPKIMEEQVRSTSL